MKQPDLNKCKSGKDFGKGFYVTTDKKQAVKFARLVAERHNVPCGIVNEYILSDISSLAYYAFENTDMDWLNCVVGNRRKQFKHLCQSWDSYDILSGKVANDDTSTVINAYLLGIYGDIGSLSAASAAISNLEPDNLKDQLCLKTDKAISRLHFVKSETVAK